MSRKRQILWISPYAPYDKVAHAGGKSHNFYIKYFQKSGQYEITLLSLCLKEEEKKLDLDYYDIKNHIFVMDQTLVAKILRLLISGLAYRNPYDAFGGICLPYERYHMMKLILKYRAEEKVPDIIILQWTFSLMFIETIKHMFPDSKVLAIEEDVTFLNFMRRKERAIGNINSFFWSRRFSIMKKVELNKLQKADIIVTNNLKDTKLLLDNQIDREMIFTAAPYMDDYSGICREPEGKDIIFFGAMSRHENYLSAIWFIENVMPLVSDTEIRFIIIGSSPDISLFNYESERVIITGFVTDVSDYFSKCMCMVAPLVGGAGIKIKILEAMSAGIPVLTNEIGIEGIGAKDKVEFFLCNEPEDYATYINDMAAGRQDTKRMSENARRYICENYDLTSKLNKLMKIL